MNQSFRVPKVLHADTPHGLHVVSDAMALLVRGVETQGEFALVHAITEPGQGPPLHMHHREDETFYILQGEYEFRVGDTRHRAGTGATVFAPRNFAHAYRNTGDAPAQMLVLLTPAGFDRFFEQISRLTLAGQADPETLTRVAAEFGCDILGPPLE